MVTVSDGHLDVGATIDDAESAHAQFRCRERGVMNGSRGQLATITLQIPASMKEELARLARATGRQQAVVAVEAIGRYLETEASQIAEIQEAILRADAGDYASEESVTAVREKFRSLGSTPA
jgi:RHH-type transcriptional regulator, rel operon repressor / antitoxin RelB